RALRVPVRRCAVPQGARRGRARHRRSERRGTVDPAGGGAELPADAFQLQRGRAVERDRRRRGGRARPAPRPLAARARAVSSPALVASTLAAPRQPVRLFFVAVVAAALVLKAFAFALMRADALIWLTPGAQDGLVAGLVIALAAVSLPRVARLGLAAMLILAS